MKVLLINPPMPEKENWVREGRCQQLDIWGAPFPPLSLAYIAGQIKDIVDTLIIDSGPAHLDLKWVLEKIKKYNPDLIILSVSTPTINSDLGWFLDKINAWKPDLKTAAIGIHVTALPQNTLKKFRSLDFVISREPELTARELVLALKNKRVSFKDIQGLVFRQNGKIIINSPRPFLKNLDRLELPFWSGVNFQNYRMPIFSKSFTLINFARGCPFGCKFCNAHTYYGKRTRKRSPEKIIKEINYYINNFGVKDFLFWTESITIDIDYLRSFLNLLRKEKLNKKIKWVCNSRVDVLDLNIFREMRKAGCWQIAFGFEFGSNKILKLAQKGGRATVIQGKRAAEAAVKAGLVVDGHFILGYPGEKEEDLQKTIKFACELPLTFAHFYVVTPFPGSVLFQEALDQKWLNNFDWQDIGQNKAILRTEFLAPETIEKYISRAYKKFYLRPAIFYRMIKIPNTPREFFVLLKIGVQFISTIFKK